MKKVITYGTFDLFHEGHLNLLKQAKNLGDYLIVGVTSEYFDKSRGKFNIHDTLMTRINNVLRTGLVDEVIIEEYFGQKIDDIKRYNIDIFTVGSDWTGYFDYLNDYCEVIYSKRTEGISSTKIRNKNNLKLGILGTERIVDRFISESKFVSGVELNGIFNPILNRERKCKNLLLNSYNTIDDLIENNDCIYINSPLDSRDQYIEIALKKGKHVLTEFPFCKDYHIAQKLVKLANKNNVLLMEAIKTVYCPAFIKLISIAKSGIIGKILNVEARFTQILDIDLFNEQLEIAGGSIESLSSYPLLVIFKLLGTEFIDIKFSTHKEQNTDIFTKIELTYKEAIASATVAIKAKAEGNLVITGTKGYIYVPAPWWKTEYFEVCYEDINKNNKYFYKFEGEGLRYEIVEFIKSINNNSTQNHYFTHNEMLTEANVINLFLSKKNITSF